MKCIICNSKKFKIISSRVRDSNKHKIVECEKCHLLQLFPVPSIKEDKEFYDENRQSKNIGELQDLKIMRENSLADTKRRAELISKEVTKGKKVLDIGVDALIVADLALLLTLRQMGIDTNIIISTGGHIFNSEAAQFYQDLGASRIILPRHLTIEEIRNIKDNVGEIELEVFILNSRCPNIDGFCTFQHGLADESFELLHKNACMLHYDISATTDINYPLDQISWERQYIWQMIHVDDYPCGACALYEFNEMGITSIKIVGRGNPTPRKIADAVFIRFLLDLLEAEKPTKDQFRGVARNLYSTIYKRSCRVPMCYYPEVLV